MSKVDNLVKILGGKKYEQQNNSNSSRRTVIIHKYKGMK